MANVWEFSPDAGTTKYDITDLQGRDDIDGINLFEPVNVGLISPETVGEGTFIGNSGNTAVVARIEHNTEYIARHEGGNRFRLALSMEKPVAGGACYTVVNDVDAKSYTFNSGNYNYVLLHCNNVALSLDTIKPMCYDASFGANFPYRPYNQQSIQHQINDITGVTGVRNICPFYPYIATSYGVQSSNIGNGTVRYTTPESATGVVWFGISQPDTSPNVSMYAHTLKKGSYKLVVNSSQALSSDVQVGLLLNNVNLNWVNSGTHNVIPFSLSEDTTFYLGVRFSNGATITNIDIQAFIILASDPDATYVPYAMTNRELTEKLAYEDLTSQIQWDGATYFTPLPNDCKLIKKDGKYYVKIQGTQITSATQFVKIATLPFTVPLTDFINRYFYWGVNTAYDLKILGNEVYIRGSISSNATILVTIVL